MLSGPDIPLNSWLSLVEVSKVSLFFCLIRRVDGQILLSRDDKGWIEGAHTMFDCVGLSQFIRQAGQQ